MEDTQAPPNHHADCPGFAGVAGLVAAPSMSLGRKGDAELAVRLSSLAPGEQIVDLGCGPGVAVRHAARLGAEATGVDPSAVMLRVARRLTRRSLQVKYLEGAAEAIPLGDGSGSVIWSIATVHHWSDLDAGLQEALRILRSRGRLVAIERRTQPGAKGHKSHGWTDEQATAFAARCRGHGFTDVRIEHTTIRRRSTVSVVALAP